MKNLGLVYASILSKKVAMKCTHALVDVKVGRDSKIFAPWMNSGDINAFFNKDGVTELLPKIAGSFLMPRPVHN